jgi:hypothetical protein
VHIGADEATRRSEASKGVSKVKHVRAAVAFLIFYGMVFFIVFHAVNALYALEHVVQH